MENEKTFYKHSIALLAIFVFGNIIISFPKGEGRHQGFWGYLVCFGVSVALSFYYAWLHSKNAFDISLISCKTVKNIFVILFIFFAGICYFICCKDYVHLIDEVRLPQTSAVIISVIFVSLTVLIACLNKRIIFLFAIPVIIFLSVVTVITFILSIPNFNFKLLINNLEFNFADLAKQGLTFFIHSFGQIVIFAFFLGNKSYKTAKKIHLYGVFLGCSLLVICLLNVVLVLGTTVIDSLDYPYSTVTGIIMLGKAYSRMDGLTYYIYFICSLLKASIILSVILTFCGAFSKSLKKAAAVLIPVLSVIFSSSKFLNTVLQGKIINFIVLILEVILPVSLTVLTLKRVNLPE